MALRVVVSVVDPDDNRQIHALSWRGDQNLARATLEVESCVVAAAELTGGFDHDVHAEVAPPDRSGLARAERSYGLAIDDDRVLIVRDVGCESAKGRVKGQQMRERARVGDVVDGDDLEVVVLQAAPDERSPDPAEAIDSDADRHCHSPWLALPLACVPSADKTRAAWPPESSAEASYVATCRTERRRLGSARGARPDC